MIGISLGNFLMNLRQLIKLFMPLSLFPAHAALQPFFGQIQLNEEKQLHR